MLVLKGTTDADTEGTILHVGRRQVRQHQPQGDEGHSVEAIFEQLEVFVGGTLLACPSALPLLDVGSDAINDLRHQVVEECCPVDSPIFDALLDSTFHLLTEGLDAHHRHFTLKLVLLHDQVSLGFDRFHGVSSL